MSSDCVAAVGIDLGTTNSVVAVYKDGEVHVLLDEEGRNFTPSVVAYTETNQLVGWRALRQYAQNPENTVSEVKRLMGCKFADLKVQEDMQRWPFKVVEKDGEPRIQVEYRAETRQWRPEQVSAIVLKRLKEMACAFLEVSPFSQLEAVVTVPVHFGDSQRQATKEACDIVGFKVVNIITEPAAAALAYAMRNKSEATRVLVFDMGGGTTDVSLLRTQPGFHHEVLACKGDNHLGGEDLDSLVVQQCLDRLYEDRKVRIQSGQHVPLTRLRQAVEAAKCSLSGDERATIRLDEIQHSVDFQYEISRATFQALCKPLFHRALKMVEDCLMDAKVSKSDISTVVLAGGSTRIPRLQEILSDLLPGATLHFSVQQEAAVAYGAALFAAKQKGILTQELHLTEVLPWSLGTDVEGGLTSIILRKYTPIPTMKIQKYSTTVDNQKSFTIEVYEGDHELCADNRLLGSMVLAGIRLAPKGYTKVRVLFNVDEHGILQVKAKEVGSDNKISVTIERYKKSLTEGQINGMRKTIIEERVQTQVAQLAEQMAELENTLENTLNDIQKKVIHKETLKVRAWSKNNPTLNSEAFEQLLQELRDTFAILGLDTKLDNAGTISYNTPQ